MSLRVWLPLNGDLHNQGLDGDYQSTSNNYTINAQGKIGKCIKGSTSGTIDTSVTKDVWDFTSKNISFGCWAKIKKEELEAITTTKTYTSIYTNCQGVLLGNDNYGGFGLHWRTNNIYTNGELTHIVVFTYLRNTSSKIYSSGEIQIPFDTWTNIFVILNKDDSIMQLYINGELVKTTNYDPSYFTSSTVKQGNFFINNAQIGGGNANAIYAPWYINDVRIYDHTLSAKEIKEISKALVLHYPLDDVIQELDNCYAYPTFDTSSAGGGWTHWGSSGKHDGHYGQNTDKQYIFNKINTYSHWVSNGSTATANYLVYQSPAFEGGYRSAQFIIKEENSLPITESICYPTWNNRDGGVPNNQWTSVKHLSDGFYLCKVEGLHQDGNNDLIGVYVCPSYKIYISEGYCENDKTICSDIFFPYSNIVYDCSGYGNNGTINGMLSYDSNTTRYFISTLFDGIESSIKVPFDATVWQTNFTMNLWFKKDELGSKNYETLFGGQNGFEMDTRANTATTLSLYMASTRGTIYSPFNFGEWYMVTMVNNGTNELYYINGELVKTIGLKSMPSGSYYIGAWQTATKQNYKGNISDFRLYATVLSADDIKELYDTGMSIDNKQNIHTYELDETYSTIGLKKTGVLNAKDIFTEDDSVGIYKSGLITANQFYER